MACYKPIQIRNPDKKSVLLKITVSCGRCIGCRLERSRQWAIRCVHESQMHENNCFLTLTYNDENLSWGVERPTLQPRDLQLFLKRLRKKYGPGIRFFACGEYGGITYRPHYHTCIFGLDFQDKKLYSIKNGINLYTSNDLSNIWGHGNCLIGDVTFESAAYVARYIVDKKLGETANYYTEQSIMPEFVRMSRRPGIGKTWLNKYNSDVFPNDTVIIRGGIKCLPPRYYLKLIEQSNPVQFQQVKTKRKNKLNDNYDKNTPEKLKIRETIKLAQINSLTRKL